MEFSVSDEMTIDGREHDNHGDGLRDDGFKQVQTMTCDDDRSQQWVMGASDDNGSER
jgi:hypothetical protein